MPQTRRPADKPNHIIIFREDNELDALAVTKLLSYFEHVLVLTDIEQLKKLMLEPQPKVLFFSFEQIESSFEQYYTLIESLDLTECCEHKFVALCKKNEEEIAFAAYNTQIVDEYLISRPLYEKTRPVMLAKQCLRELGVHYSPNGRVQYTITNLELQNELHSIIQGALEKKQAFKQQLENSIIRLDSAISEAGEKFAQNQKAELNLDDVKNLLAQIRSNEVRPELIELQNKALSLLNRFVKSTSDLAGKLGDSPPNAQQQAEQTEISSDKTQAQIDDEMLAAANAQEAPHAAKHDFSVIDVDFEKRLAELENPKKVRVLLVEDDEISLNLSAKLFKKNRFQFDYAVSGRDALNKLNNAEFDVVFMDINLPDADGLAIASQLANSADNKNCSVVVLTGNHSKLSIKRAGQVGAKAYLIKPLRESTLKAALGKCGY